MKKTIRIGTRTVGGENPAYVIAEVGSNHDGELEKAKALVRCAAEAGADAVKFQSFTASGLLNPLKPNGGGPWVAHPAYPVIEALTVPEEWHGELKASCEESGVTFLSAPFDSGRSRLLRDLGVAAFKLASGEITNEPLIREVASFRRPVILSTGASFMHEVQRAVALVLDEGNSDIALLHCASLYPPSYRDVNLRAMTTLSEEFGCPVGLSDHTPGDTMAVAAVAMGASIIEKHITTDRRLPGPDHPYAMEVEEFASMVKAIRNVEAAMGDGIKKPSEPEMGERTGARRAVYAATDIAKGTVLTPELLKVVRHAHGLEPVHYSGALGKVVQRDINKDMPLQKGDV